MAKASKGDDAQYTEQEITERLKQALRGARMVEPTPMKDLPRKRREAQREPKGAGSKRVTSRGQGNT